MRHTLSLLSLAGLLLLGGCDPQDRRPGLWLSGETVEQLPEAWSFTDAEPEIFIEVTTPYLLPHSVTIWCATVDGTLYVGARDPDSKRWPGWADRRPEVKLKIGEQVYPVRLVTLEDSGEIQVVQQAYAAKYQLPSSSGASAMRYWRVVPRA